MMRWLMLASVMSLTAVAEAAEPAGEKRPNFVIFFTDDQGYNDVGCFGSPQIETPRLDRMAAEGMKLTSFYAQIVCGPSRAAIMTGCYPIRVAEPGNEKHPHTILHSQEVTIAEVLKRRGYATACIGKWHLAGGDGGSKPRGRGPFPTELMPNAQGFDYFFGTPLHNGTTRKPRPQQYVTQLRRNDQVVEENADMDQLTRRYTKEAISFIREHREEPFFLYLAHNMPHVPLGASDRFRGKSPRGLYGDVISELDWSCGEVLDSLAELGLDDDTLVVFTSDNGPWIEKHLGDHGGSAAPLRGFKMSTWEGGSRVPCIMRWPGKIAAGRTSDELATTLDLAPTFAALAGAELPADHTLDGYDLTAFLTGDAATASPREEFLYYAFTHLQAVRDDRWKLVLPREANPPWTSWYGRMIDAVPEVALYDMLNDPGEEDNVAAQHPDIVANLQQRITAAREELGDYNRIGSGARFFDAGPQRPKAARWQAH